MDTRHIQTVLANGTDSRIERTRQAHTRPVEIGVRGFVAKSTTTLLLDFGFQGRSLKGALNELSEAADLTPF